jgi:hypothetical protein
MTRSNVGCVLLVLVLSACKGGDQGAALKELQRAHSAAVDVVLLSDGETLKQGRGSFVLEFRGPGGQLLDVGTVKVNATMAMAGMSPMFGTSDVQKSDTPGRYVVTSDLGMAGTWRLMVEWDGPAGHGSASLPGAVG